MTAWKNRNRRMKIRQCGLFTSILMGASDSEVKLKGTGRDGEPGEGPGLPVVPGHGGGGAFSRAEREEYLAGLRGVARDLCHTGREKYQCEIQEYMDQAFCPQLYSMQSSF